MTAIPRPAIFFSLLALLAVTRAGHFGTAISLPDASLAVFLLGGMWLGGTRLNGWGCFASYIAVAFGIDVYLAKTAVEAGWCLTPAYGGLVAAYGAVWLFGRLLAKTPELPPLRLLVVGLLAVASHFLISNLSFWALSGYFAQMPLSEYASIVVKYFPPYLASTALYLTVGWIVQRALAARQAAKA
jgi:hypothetical protein